MASFDFVTAAGNAYLKTWQERHYLFQMVLVPLVVKFICYAVAVFYLDTENIIRISLVMLPAYFAEGWFLAHWVRTIVLDHRWPFRSSGNEKKDLELLKERGRGIIGATVTFALVNFLMGGYFAFFMSYIPLDADPQQADPKIALVGISLLVTALMLFRFLWLYVPLAINYPLESVMAKLRFFGITFPLMGVWLLCFVPAVTLLQLFSAGLMNIAGENPIPMMEGLIAFVRIFLDTIKNLLCTAGMAFAFIELFGWKKKKT